MRILHIDTGRELRGGQHQALMLMEGLREAGHVSELLARSGTPIWNAARRLDFAVEAATLQTLWTRSAFADVVHAHDARSHTLAAFASRQLFVVSRRVGFRIRAGLPSRWKYRRARRFLAVSRVVAAELERAGIPAAKIDIVYDGIDIDRRPERQAENEFPVVALGSTDPEKGRDLVERAARLAHVPVKFSEDLTEDLRRASSFVYITRSEGFGSAALVAMSLGVPVIASRVGGLPEIIIDEESGLLVDNHPPTIAAAILRVLREPALAEKLARNGRLRVEQNFSRQGMVEATLRSYAMALAG